MRTMGGFNIKGHPGELRLLASHGHNKVEYKVTFSLTFAMTFPAHVRILPMIRPQQPESECDRESRVDSWASAPVNSGRAISW